MPAAAVQNETQGFNVPVTIYEYIQEHGGFDVSGSPFTSYEEYGQFFRQCFRNVCILVDPTAQEYRRLFPESLGYSFLRMARRSGETDSFEAKGTGGGGNGSEELKIQAKQESSYVSQEEPQIISILVTNMEFEPSGRR